MTAAAPSFAAIELLVNRSASVGERHDAGAHMWRRAVIAIGKLRKTEGK